MLRRARRAGGPSMSSAQSRVPNQIRVGRLPDVSPAWESNRKGVAFSRPAGAARGPRRDERTPRPSKESAESAIALAAVSRGRPHRRS